MGFEPKLFSSPALTQKKCSVSRKCVTLPQGTRGPIIHSPTDKEGEKGKEKNRLCAQVRDPPRLLLLEGGTGTGRAVCSRGRAHIWPGTRYTACSPRPFSSITASFHSFSTDWSPHCPFPCQFPPFLPKTRTANAFSSLATNILLPNPDNLLFSFLCFY